MGDNGTATQRMPANPATVRQTMLSSSQSNLPSSAMGTSAASRPPTLEPDDTAATQSTTIVGHGVATHRAVAHDQADNQEHIFTAAVPRIVDIGRGERITVTCNSDEIVVEAKTERLILALALLHIARPNLTAGSKEYVTAMKRFKQLAGVRSLDRRIYVTLEGTIEFARDALNRAGDKDSAVRTALSDRFICECGKSLLFIGGPAEVDLA